MVPSAGTADHHDQRYDGHCHPASSQGLRYGDTDNPTRVLWIQQYFVYVNRLLDVLDRMWPEIGETDVKLAFDLIVNPSGNTDATRIGKVFYPGGNVHAIAVNTIILVDDISQVNTNAKIHATFVGQFAVFCIHYFP